MTGGRIVRMFKKKLTSKCLAFGLSFAIVFGSMSGMAVRAEENGTGAGSGDVAAGTAEAEEANECPAGSGELQICLFLIWKDMVMKTNLD